MTRKKRKAYQHRFELYADDETEQKLHEYLGRLAESGKQREWIVSVLVAQLDDDYTFPKPPSVRVVATLHGSRIRSEIPEIAE